MGNSLGDQFLKMGLVDKKKLKSAKKQKHKQSVQTAKTGELSESQKQAKQAQQQKTERDREINRQNQLQAEKKAIAAQIKQLIDMNKLSREGAEIKYNFTHTQKDGVSKIKSLYVTSQMSEQLSKGLLAVVSLNDGYELIPRIVADKISLRDESSILVCNQIDEEDIQEDDPYADYQIPDDLMW